MNHTYPTNMNFRIDQRRRDKFKSRCRKAGIGQSEALRDMIEIFIRTDAFVVDPSTNQLTLRNP